MRRTSKEELLMADCGRQIALHSVRLSMGSRSSLLLGCLQLAGCRWKAPALLRTFLKTHKGKGRKRKKTKKRGIKSLRHFV